jgi:UDP-N-acetylglucosamine 1-carboxyvinyltransferase
MEDDHPDHPRAARIHGPHKLKGTDLDASDIRAGATVVIAALAAEGVSRVSGVHHVERGYEDFVARLRGLGAEIEVVHE